MKSSLWETTKTVIYAVLIALIIRTAAYEPFNIPSGSMIPTLLIGDYLFVSKYSYGYSRHSFPLSAAPFSGRIFKSAPRRGDVAVFKLPSDNETDYIKRIIGLPGDKIQVKSGRLYINDKLIKRKIVDPFPMQNDFGKFIVAKRYIETLPNGKNYEIIENSGDTGPLDNTPIYFVPKGHYFAMGDNRDNSLDSRIPNRQGINGVGYIPAENLVGRAEVVFFSTDGSASIFEPWGWYHAARFKRFFQGIQ